MLRGANGGRGRDERGKKAMKITVDSRQCYRDSIASIFYAIAPENCSFRRLARRYSLSSRCMRITPDARRCTRRPREKIYVIYRYSGETIEIHYELDSDGLVLGLEIVSQRMNFDLADRPMDKNFIRKFIGRKN